MRPALTVMTPIYNGEDFVDRCYFMLRAQTFTDWEWIVVNDGSKDQTEKRIKSLQDPRIRLISYVENQGRGFARSQALQAASGDWLVVWDVDDIYFPDRLEKANQARLNGYDFCCSYTVLLDNSLQIVGYRGFTTDDSGSVKMFVHPSSSFSLRHARLIGYDHRLRAGEDTELLLYLAHQCNGQWLQDPVLAYQHTREINLRKTITSNRGKLLSYRKLFKKGMLKIKPLSYIKIELKLQAKLALLNLFLARPSVYLRTVKYRSSGTIDSNWQLSNEHSSYLDTIRERNNRHDWSIA